MAINYVDENNQKQVVTATNPLPVNLQDSNLTDPLPVSISSLVVDATDEDRHVVSLLKELIRQQKITNEYLAEMLGDRIDDI